jgi:hypothetical protein
MKNLILSAILAVAFYNSSQAFYIPPTPSYILYSPNGMYFATMSAEAGVNDVYSTSDPSTSLWHFQSDLSGQFFLSNDGQSIIHLSEKWIFKGGFRNPGATIFRQNGQIGSYSIGRLSRPRKYHKHESGPNGSFWRVWLEKAWQINEGVVIVTPPHRKRRIVDFQNLSLTKG